MATQPLICLVDLSAMILIIVFDGSAIVLSWDPTGAKQGRATSVDGNPSLRCRHAVQQMEPIYVTDRKDVLSDGSKLRVDFNKRRQW
jgi:hypothetical protein